MASSMGLRNAKNVQSAVSSNVFVGLRAETLHAIDMHATKFHSDDGMDIFKELKQLKEEIEKCKTKLNTLKLNDLNDLKIDQQPTDGDTLVYSNDTQCWQVGTLSS
jgi:hypothetical protein